MSGIIYDIGFFFGKYHQLLNILFQWKWPCVILKEIEETKSQSGVRFWKKISSVLQIPPESLTLEDFRYNFLKFFHQKWSVRAGICFFSRFRCKKFAKKQIPVQIFYTCWCFLRKTFIGVFLLLMTFSGLKICKKTTRYRS